MAALLCSFFALAVAIPAPHLNSNLVVEQVNVAAQTFRQGWTSHGLAPRDASVNLTIAVKYTNSGALHDLWWSVSNPRSEKYGHFLTAEELHKFLSVDEASVPAIVDWLETHEATVINVSHLGNFVTASLPVANAERMLGIGLHEYSHESFHANQRVIRTTHRVTAPSHLSSHIHVISGVSDFSQSGFYRHIHSEERADKRSRALLAKGKLHDDPTTPNILFLQNGNHDLEFRFQPNCPEAGPYGNLCDASTFSKEVLGFQLFIDYPSDSSLSYNTSISVGEVTCYENGGVIYQCVGYTNGMNHNYKGYTLSIATNFSADPTKLSPFSPPSPVVINGAWALPNIVKRLYNITMCTPGDVSCHQSTVPTESSGGVILFQHEYYSPDDLVKYMDSNYLDSTPAAVVAPTDENDPSHPGAEGQADIELLSANGVGSMYSTFWYSTDNSDGVLQWALQVAATADETVPKVWSLSWGIPEIWFDEYVGDGAQERIDLELAAMGVRGLTILVASGDAGVRPVGREVAGCGEFMPSYPASSQYVVSVGATMLVEGSSVSHSEPPSLKANYPICDLKMGPHNISCDDEGVWQTHEVVVSCCDLGAVWTSGAGFSVNYTRPSWQDKAVKGYFERVGDALPPSNLWNSLGRAYPDISVIGDKVPVVRGGQLDNFGGTSASTPIAAGLITQLNSARLSRSKPLLGAVAPLLYAIYEDHNDEGAIHDITVGHNNCGEMECCEHGFQASEGWDAVAGLGSISFADLREVILHYYSN